MANPDFYWIEFSKNTRLTTEVRRSLQDRLDSSVISQYQTLSEEFMEEFSERLDFDKLCRYQKLSESFIRRCLERGGPVNLALISEFQTLSTSFML
ncbi:hypothetical protein NPIL_365581 [Nephila pilipes]|uniref:Uncharacterized protein n=1 Tax=Nephila pilipes TaxID=299642 RepID=A0A8X6U6S3_NEPPI|nr:hypothetical protein NPIL_365581 [Nephila pilipes]